MNFVGLDSFLGDLRADVFDQFLAILSILCVRLAIYSNSTVIDAVALLPTIF